MRRQGKSRLCLAYHWSNFRRIGAASVNVLVNHLGTSILSPDSVSGRIIRRFLWSGFALLAASLLGMDLYVAQHSAELWRPLLGVTLAVLVLAGGLAFLFIRSFSLRVSQIRAYAERLLDPPSSSSRCPAGDDDLGLLARSPATHRASHSRTGGKPEVGRRATRSHSGQHAGRRAAVDKDLRVTFCNYSFARNVDARLPVVPWHSLLELVRDPDCERS